MFRVLAAAALFYYRIFSCTELSTGEPKEGKVEWSNQREKLWKDIWSSYQWAKFGLLKIREVYRDHMLYVN